MNLQHERVSHLCTELRLGGVAVEYSAAAQKAAETKTPFVDFLETVLRGELETRRARARTMLSLVAGFPAIKTLDQFDFEFAVGAPRQQIQQLAWLSFIERAENVILLGPLTPSRATPRSAAAWDGLKRTLPTPSPRMTLRLTGLLC